MPEIKKRISILIPQPTINQYPTSLRKLLADALSAQLNNEILNFIKTGLLISRLLMELRLDE